MSDDTGQLSLAIAASNAHKLTAYFDMEDKDFDALPKVERNQLWSKVLGVEP